MNHSGYEAHRRAAMEEAHPGSSQTGERAATAGQGSMGKGQNHVHEEDFNRSRVWSGRGLKHFCKGTIR